VNTDPITPANAGLVQPASAPLDASGKICVAQLPPTLNQSRVVTSLFEIVFQKVAKGSNEHSKRQMPVNSSDSDDLPHNGETVDVM
jgi:hypothetical protein